MPIKPNEAVIIGDTKDAEAAANNAVPPATTGNDTEYIIRLLKMEVEINCTKGRVKRNKTSTLCTWRPIVFNVLRSMND